MIGYKSEKDKFKDELETFKNDGIKEWNICTLLCTAGWEFKSKLWVSVSLLCTRDKKYQI